MRYFVLDTTELTMRENLVVDCVLQAMCNKEIAEHLNITINTVKRHLITIFDKVGCSSRLELFHMRHDVAHRMEIEALQRQIVGLKEQIQLSDLAGSNSRTQ